MKSFSFLTNFVLEIWIYDPASGTLKTFASDNCLAAENGQLVLQPCNGDFSQAFDIPFQWKPAISSVGTYDLVLMRMNGLNYCMDASEAASSDYANMPWTIGMKGRPVLWFACSRYQHTNLI